MNRTDYHIHTRFSDGRGDPDDYIPIAKVKGLSEIGFSDHLTLTDEPQGWSMPPERLPEYFDTIGKLAKKHSEIGILTGIEVDYLPDKIDEIEDYINSYPFDYVIGSVHYMGDETVDLGKEFYDNKDIGNLFADYFALVSEAASTGLFDIMAHPDLIRIFGHNYPGNAEPLYRQLATAIKRYDVTFEINTNGMNKPCRDFYPDRDYLHLFAEEGAILTINSDSHSPDRIGQHFDEAYDLAKKAGFTELAGFKGRERFMRPL